MTELDFFVLGHGNIGSAIVNQLFSQQAYLKSKGLFLNVCGILDSRKKLVVKNGIDLSNWNNLFLEKATDRKSLIEDVLSAFTKKNNIVLDCTADEKIALSYPQFLKNNIHIITPNKKAFSTSLSYYNDLKQISSENNSLIFYETTVGAGLPIISTLKDIILTGDKVLKIEGFISGSLSWLFSNYDGTIPFSSLIKEAYKKGYTEPDPRDDLSGMDVARKILILGRELGLPLNEIKPTVDILPDKLKKVSKEEFFIRLNEIDFLVEELWKEAESKNQILRYIGKIDNNGNYFCGPALLDKDYYLAKINNSDSILSFWTERYSANPLVIRGPGAGASVTAGGIFSDILKLATYLGVAL